MCVCLQDTPDVGHADNRTETFSVAVECTEGKETYAALQVTPPQLCKPGSETDGKQ